MSPAHGFMWPDTKTMLLALACMPLGLGAGALYFASVRRSADLLVTGAKPGVALLLTASRFILLAGVLVAVSRAGALPLLSTALGIFVSRQIVVPRLGRIDA